MTFIQAFNKIQERMSKVKEIKTDKSFFAIQVELTNKDCSGIFYIKYEDGTLCVEPYDYYDNNVAISLSYLTFNKLIDGRIDLSSAISDGKITAVGDTTAIEGILSIVPKEVVPTPTKSAPLPKKSPAPEKKEAKKSITKKQKSKSKKK